MSKNKKKDNHNTSKNKQQNKSQKSEQSSKDQTAPNRGADQKEQNTDGAKLNQGRDSADFDTNDSENMEIEKLHEEIERLESNLKGALADYQNLKKEMERRLELERKLIRRELLENVIELADDIDMAIDHVETDKGWREGVSRILEKFRKTMNDMGAEIIKCEEGDKFDSSLHEAVGVVDKGENGTIHDIVQNGYRVGDVVIRPARVIVNKISNKNKNE